MTISDESRNDLVRFVAHVAMLQQAVSRNATSDQIQARLVQLEAEALALAATLGHEDRALGDAVRQAWQEAARVGSPAAARTQHS
jgi:hypothetical protein